MTAKFQPGDRVRVTFEADVEARVQDGLRVSVTGKEGYPRMRLAYDSECELIEPPYRDPELKSGDRVADIDEPDDTRRWYRFLPNGTDHPFMHAEGWRKQRDELSDRIRVLPPLPGSREEELLKKVQDQAELPAKWEYDLINESRIASEKREAELHDRINRALKYIKPGMSNLEYYFAEGILKGEK
jgi:hypothetical protein